MRGPVSTLAVQQRDLLAVFAQARQAEAEVRLVLLLAEVEADQRMADPVVRPVPIAA